MNERRKNKRTRKRVDALEVLADTLSAEISAIRRRLKVLERKEQSHGLAKPVPEFPPHIIAGPTPGHTTAATSPQTPDPPSKTST